jgi:hypothetical protein
MSLTMMNATSPETTEPISSCTQAANPDAAGAADIVADATADPAGGLRGVTVTRGERGEGDAGVYNAYLSSSSCDHGAEFACGASNAADSCVEPKALGVV